MQHRPCCLRQRAWRLRHSRKMKSAPTRRRATSPLLFAARGTPSPLSSSAHARLRCSSFAPSKTARLRCSSFAPSKKRARGTPDARSRPQPRVHGLSLDTRASVTTKAPDRPAFRTRWFWRLASHVPRWEILCYPPLSWSGRPGLPEERRCGPCHAMARGIAPGARDLGRRAKRWQWGESPPRPHRTAWSSASAPVSCAPPESERPSTGGNRPRSGLAPETLCLGLTLPRPPHPAPRIVTIASRPS
jgi:hypothetical protein